MARLVRAQQRFLTFGGMFFCDGRVKIRHATHKEIQVALPNVADCHYEKDCVARMQNTSACAQSSQQNAGKASRWQDKMEKTKYNDDLNIPTTPNIPNTTPALLFVHAA